MLPEIIGIESIRLDPDGVITLRLVLADFSIAATHWSPEVLREGLAIVEEAPRAPATTMMRVN